MTFLSEISLKEKSGSDFPFSVPVIKNLRKLTFKTDVTFLIGENGSGKSTLLEGIAAAAGLYSIGSSSIEHDTTLNHARKLGDSLKLSWKFKTHKGFFVRSEDVFGFTKNITNTKDQLSKFSDEFSNSLSGYGEKLAVGAVQGQLRSLEEKYGKDLDANSHGETFLKIFQSRFVPGGLYLLDEPEAPLSFKRQLSLVYMIRKMVKKDSQFIIATHSPIITAIPEATILSFDGERIKEIKYKDIEQFQLMKDFLNNPDVFLRHVE